MAAISFILYQLPELGTPKVWMQICWTTAWPVDRNTVWTPADLLCHIYRQGAKEPCSIRNVPRFWLTTAIWFLLCKLLANSLKLYDLSLDANLLDHTLAFRHNEVSDRPIFSLICIGKVHLYSIVSYIVYRQMNNGTLFNQKCTNVLIDYGLLIY